MAEDKHPNVDADVRQNYADIVAERGISYDHLAADAERMGDTSLAAYLRDDKAHVDASAAAQARGAALQAEAGGDAAPRGRRSSRPDDTA